jgi:hypothetical protein
MCPLNRTYPSGSYVSAGSRSESGPRIWEYEPLRGAPIQDVPVGKADEDAAVAVTAAPSKDAKGDPRDHARDLPRDTRKDLVRDPPRDPPMTVPAAESGARRSRAAAVERRATHLIQRHGGVETSGALRNP